MESILSKALDKVVKIMESEKIDYMIVGGFAVTFYNRGRTTNDIDLVVQIKPEQVKGILSYFPLWKDFEDSFKDDVARGSMFNVTDFESGIRYDFMTFENSAYSQIAFERRVKVELLGVHCYLCSLEDLIISKLRWNKITPSAKQVEDVQFLLINGSVDQEYLKFWIGKFNLDTDGRLLG
jgi:predicted nucleotidyltransferase